jgi:hypothetical protein
MEEAGSSKTLTPIYDITLHILEDSNFNKIYSAI